MGLRFCKYCSICTQFCATSLEQEIKQPSENSKCDRERLSWHEIGLGVVGSVVRKLMYLDQILWFCFFLSHANAMAHKRDAELVSTSESDTIEQQFLFSHFIYDLQGSSNSNFARLPWTNERTLERELTQIHRALCRDCFQNSIVLCNLRCRTIVFGLG